MASVGEPINRPRYTGQRDRSQIVLAAPRDKPGAAPHQAVAGAPLVGRPGVGNCLPRTWQTWLPFCGSRSDTEGQKPYRKQDIE